MKSIKATHMTVDQFNALDDLEQAQATWEGVRLKSVVLGLHKFTLYDINGLYVEVMYNCKLDTIESFRPVNEDYHLASYYYDYDISDLTKLIAMQ